MRLHEALKVPLKMVYRNHDHLQAIYELRVSYFSGLIQTCGQSLYLLTSPSVDEASLDHLNMMKVVIFHIIILQTFVKCASKLACILQQEGDLNRREYLY